MTDGSVIQDAGNAIEPQANGKVIVSNSTLLENIVGINAVNGNFPHFFLYNTFEGNSTSSALQAFRVYSNTRVNCTGGNIQNFSGTDYNQASILMLGSSSFTGNQINFDNNGKEIEVPDGQNLSLIHISEPTRPY